MADALTDQTVSLHLVKLCVGADSVEDLGSWQADRLAVWPEAGPAPVACHVTRMWPRDAARLVNGGSLYWVIRGLILVRQRIRALARVTEADGVARCAILLDPELVRTDPRPRKAFQGWRYLPGPEAPPDISALASAEADLPPALRQALAEMGVIDG